MDKLTAIYHLFKPMKECIVWSDNRTYVCVGWQYTGGYMRWYLENDEVMFTYVKGINE